MDASTLLMLIGSAGWCGLCVFSWWAGVQLDSAKR